ncbi:hypothetical protein [Microbacterium dextranolyticum]|uniref:Alpha/beta hydrolase n=1 Tax=Microbacterium dextranolyticum TaxID=36806 RepID=A0A9W6HJT2_9MICO|nr:hypothetical protein [Microbacterium dextranolyticum]MBM7461744.1 hypothetical protein [Microbacterium dextranolyticum]GLJ93985.1 hypothetical protein GCM10017591_00460 [Microbacterium dextranolyticum]
MGEDLDIRSGGVVAVDTETLRAAAGRLRIVAGECDGVRDTIEQARRALVAAGVWATTWAILPSTAAAGAGDRCRRLASDLSSMADTYDVAELSSAASVAESAGDTALAAQLRSRAIAIMSADPSVPLRLAAATLAWRTETVAALAAQYRAPTVPGTMEPWGAEALALLATGVIGAVGLGAVPSGTRLTGHPDPVSVQRLSAGRTTAPTSLAQTVDRIPQGDGRVRVERYTMPDGGRRYVAYAAGTALGGRDDEVWDMDSNLGLYTRSQGESLDALTGALADAGAKPGDTVGLVGYSQGAMDASYAAISGVYDVPLLITFGDPVQAEVGDGTLSVAVRHLDDPVSALSAGGFAGGVGAVGSFVASRESPGTAFSGQGIIGQHALDAYRDTAVLLDRSGDPRMDGVRDRLGDLSAAVSVDAVVYGAARSEEAEVSVGPSAAGGG